MLEENPGIRNDKNPTFNKRFSFSRFALLPEYRQSREDCVNLMVDGPLAADIHRGHFARAALAEMVAGSIETYGRYKLNGVLPLALRALRRVNSVLRRKLNDLGIRQPDASLKPLDSPVHALQRRSVIVGLAALEEISALVLDVGRDLADMAPVLEQ